MDGVRSGARFNPGGYPAVIDRRHRSRFTRLPRHWRERPDHARRLIYRTDSAGRFDARNIPAGALTIGVASLGFRHCSRA